MGKGIAPIIPQSPYLPSFLPAEKQGRAPKPAPPLKAAGPKVAKVVVRSRRGAGGVAMPIGTKADIFPVGVRGPTVAVHVPRVEIPHFSEHAFPVGPGGYSGPATVQDIAQNRRDSAALPGMDVVRQIQSEIQKATAIRAHVVANIDSYGLADGSRKVVGLNGYLKKLHTALQQQHGFVEQKAELGAAADPTIDWRNVGNTLYQGLGLQMLAHTVEHPLGYTTGSSQFNTDLGNTNSSDAAILNTATGYKQIGNIAKDPLGGSVALVSLLPILRPFRLAGALDEGARAMVAAEESKIASGLDAAKSAYVGNRGYRPRLLSHNDLTAQLQKPRSLLSQAGLRLADKASLELQKSEHVTNLPGARLLSSGERVAKQAGRQQALEAIRTRAGLVDHLQAIKKVKAGSPEDVANFWYAQLPKEYRNPEGLALIRGKQADELHYIVSGKALEDLSRQESAIRAELAGAGAGTYEQVGAKLDNPEMSQDRFALLKKLEEVKLLKDDLPHREKDISASIATLEDVMGRNIPVNDKALQAVRALSHDRQQILTESGRLNPEKAAAREGLVTRFAGLEPSGDEAYVGHRLPKPESFRGSLAPSGGYGRVASPQGMSENRLVLAKTGRLRQSMQVAGEDWHSAQVFRQALRARKDLGQMGEPFKGFVPKGHVLVNPKGQLIPPHWKTDELSQFADGYEDIDHLRKKAEEIVSGFLAEHPADVQAMKDAAMHSGNYENLRVVPKRLADRYYAQFRGPGSRGLAGKAYDTAVDAVITSMVFARIGYIPKNLVQNVIMALPHQGAFFLVNATRAAQAMSDPALRHLLQGEVGGTGMTAALGKEAMHQKVLGGITSFVSKGADDPIRMAAFMHEAAAEGVISKFNPLLTEHDRASLIRLLTDKSQRPLLNDIRSRSVESMADFSRMTPTQKRYARRVAIIPGWLMAGSRYPFHFALTHPVRSALLAYIAMGEPGAPDALHFNHPLTDYLKGSGYTQGIQTPMGRLRTDSISPVSTPIGLAEETVNTVEGKTNPFDFTHPTLFGEVNPLAAFAINVAQGAGIGKEAESLVPDYKLAKGLISPQASKTYPGDKTPLGRLEREIGVIPIPVKDAAQTLSPQDAAHKWVQDTERVLGQKLPPEVVTIRNSQELYKEMEKAAGSKLTDIQRGRILLHVLVQTYPAYGPAEPQLQQAIAQDPKSMVSYFKKELNWGVVAQLDHAVNDVKKAKKAQAASGG